MIISRRGSKEALNWIKCLVENPPENECVIWPFKPAVNGYGRLSYKNKQYTAHRFALALYTGRNPKELYAAHGPCHNRLCCNPHPSHGMRWATPKSNAADKYRDGSNQNGENSGHAILTEADVFRILELREFYSGKQIANIFNVHPSTVSAIFKGRIWGSLTGISFVKATNKYSDELILNVVSLSNEGLLQREIAEKTGISQPVVSQILLGKKRNKVTGIERR